MQNNFVRYTLIRCLEHVCIQLLQISDKCPCCFQKLLSGKSYILLPVF